MSGRSTIFNDIAGMIGPNESNSDDAVYEDFSNAPDGVEFTYTVMTSSEEDPSEEDPSEPYLNHLEDLTDDSSNGFNSPVIVGNHDYEDPFGVNDSEDDDLFCDRSIYGPPKYRPSAKMAPIMENDSDDSDGEGYLNFANRPENIGRYVSYADYITWKSGIEKESEEPIYEMDIWGRRVSSNKRTIPKKTEDNAKTDRIRNLVDRFLCDNYACTSKENRPAGIILASALSNLDAYNKSDFGKFILKYVGILTPAINIDHDYDDVLEQVVRVIEKKL
jgi:hypothetical protein